MANDTEDPMVLRDEEDAQIARPRPRRRRGFLILSLVVLAGLGFAGVLYYTYNKGKEVGTSSVPPVIRADEGPTRIRPEAPGGMSVPDRDKEVFSRIDPTQEKPKTERLLPPPETPMKVPEPAQQPTPTETAKAPESKATPATDVPAPKDLAAEVKQPEAPKSASTAPPAAMAKETPKIATEPPPAKPAPQIAATAPSSGTGPAIRSGDVLVQLGALRSDEGARQRWASLKGKYPDLFAGLSLRVQKVDLGSGKGVFYRIQAGPLGSLEAAHRLCESAKKHKVGCFVVSR